MIQSTDGNIGIPRSIDVAERAGLFLELRKRLNEERRGHSELHSFCNKLDMYRINSQMNLLQHVLQRCELSNFRRGFVEISEASFGLPPSKQTDV